MKRAASRSATRPIPSRSSSKRIITDEAQVVAETIVSDPDIWGVIGHFTSGVCMATAPTYQDYDYRSHPDQV